MTQPIERNVLTVTSGDGARARLQLHVPPHPQAAVYWIPALGVGIGPYERFADALAERGVAVAVHEWRGLGNSDRRASRRCDWGYRELLDLDIVAGLAAARERLPGLRWHLGGHSLGGQFALIEAARRGAEFEGVFLVASGQPHWRAFPGSWKSGVLVFAHAIPIITSVVGHFPGSRLGFAGREASRLMRDWAGTAIRGDYRLASFGDALEMALARHSGRILAIRMHEDRLAPPGAIDRLRELTPRADWTVLDFGRNEFTTRRPDHFGWLREPESVAAAFEPWRRVGEGAATSASVDERRAVVPPP